MKSLLIFLLLVGFTLVATEIKLDGGDSDNVDENTASATVISILTTVNTGTDSSYIYSLSSGIGDEDNSKFSIEDDKLKLNFIPDYENPIDLGDTANNNTYSIRINSDFTDTDDYNSAINYHGGFYNADNYPNTHAFAALKSDGSISTWGDSSLGGSGAPTDSGYVKIYSSYAAFAALKSDGSIRSWGNMIDAPTDSGYVKIYSSYTAFAALKSDGSISTWGDASYEGSGAPTDSGYVKIYSTRTAFAALKSDGSIYAWGDSSSGGSGAPTDSGYVKIYSTRSAFLALKPDGSIYAWGDSSEGGSGAPTDSGYVKIYSTYGAFAALKSDGSISSWGNSVWGGSGAPTDSGYVKIYSTGFAFAALKSDGSIFTWGDTRWGGSGAPTDSGYTIPYGLQNKEKSFIITVNDLMECGNGVIEGIEACDDGNTTPNDGCSFTCTVETNYNCANNNPSVCSCSSGYQDNDNNGTCLVDCSNTTCDTNAICDDGTGVVTCSCNTGYSGDGVTCDDINECLDNNLNNCNADATCTNNAGSFTCICNSGYHGDGTSCVEECGDGVKTASEACDDNNKVNGDGCSDSCNPELGWTCTNELPSVCTEDDSDEDGVVDNYDNCSLVSNSDQLDTDSDGRGNVCDEDDDNDTIVDIKDNCPLVANLNQSDVDGDKVGDLCDNDDNREASGSSMSSCSYDSSSESNSYLMLLLLGVFLLISRKKMLKK